jgi:hypothetical protein
VRPGRPRRAPGADGAVELSQPRVGEPWLPRKVESERGDVDPDHLVPAVLEVQADAPQPISSPRPRTNLIARRSCDHEDWKRRQVVVFFSGFDEETNEQLVRAAGLTILEARVEPCKSPKANQGEAPRPSPSTG